MDFAMEDSIAMIGNGVEKKPIFRASVGYNNS